MRYPLSRALRHQSISSGTPFSNPPDRVENGAPDEHRGGDREVEVPDVPLVLKGEDALERFGRRHPLAGPRQGRPPARRQNRPTAARRGLLRASAGRGRQSLSMKAIASPRDARTPALRAGPAPRSATSTTRPRVPTIRRTASSPRELPLSATMTSVRSLGKLCSCEQRQTGVQVVIVVEVRHDHGCEVDLSRPPPVSGSAASRSRRSPCPAPVAL